LEKAIELDQKKVDLYLMLASVFENKKAYEKALAVLDQGLKKDQKNVELIFRQGVVLDKMGEKTRSLDRMSTIIEIDPNHADALNYIGYTYAEQGIRLDEAMSLIEKALSIKPDSGYIIDSLGWVYFQKGMYDEALKYLEQAASVPNIPIMEHLGDVYLRKECQTGRSICMKKPFLSIIPKAKSSRKDGRAEKARELILA
jgi:tetratricopeptide (TPR) repeat protein